MYVCIYKITHFAKANNSVFKHELIKLYSLLSVNKLHKNCSYNYFLKGCGEGGGAGVVAMLLSPAPRRQRQACFYEFKDCLNLHSGSRQVRATVRPCLKKKGWGLNGNCGIHLKNKTKSLNENEIWEVAVTGEKVAHTTFQGPEFSSCHPHLQRTQHPLLDSAGLCTHAHMLTPTPSI